MEIAGAAGEGVAGRFCLRHLEHMSETATYPYSFVIIPPKSEGGSYQWAIRRNGKLVQRSDRNFLSEAKAREHASAVIEKLLSGTDER